MYIKDSMAAILEKIYNQRGSTTVHFAGQAVTGEVTDVGEDYVELKKADCGYIIIRMSSVDAIVEGMQRDN